MDEIRFEQVIQAPAAQVYRAFTNATALREWLCDTATVSPKVGGHVYVSWNEGYYAAGEYTRLEKDCEVAFTWRGRREPGESQVQVTLQPEGEATRLILVHSGLGDGPEWQHSHEEIRQGWQRGLENLASTLGSGPDLRITNRPMLGILFGTFNEEIARELGVPVTEGTKLEGTVEGMGAHAAGLQGNDVLVEMAGSPITDFPSLTNVLGKHKAGDTVSVTYYRGAEKRQAQMELSRRPLPATPATPAELAAALDTIYQQEQTELTKALVGVTDTEAAFRATPEQWNVMEIVAHLILSERGTQEFIHELYFGEERVSDGFGDNLLPEVQALARVYGSLNTIVEAFRLARAETVAFLAGLPPALTERKASFWRLGFLLLSGSYHVRQHAQQIQEAISAARSKVAA